MTDSTLSGNSASATDINYPEYAYGGGIYAYGKATVSRSTLSDNSTTAFGGGGGGGGIYGGGTLTVSRSTLSDNSATIVAGIVDGDGGGGILNGGTLSVTRSTLSDNSTDVDGGGIDNGWTLHVADSTLSGNSADSDGGGIFNGGTLTVTASTLSENSAESAGAGIDNEFGHRARAAASIVANSPSGDDCSGGITDAGYNLDDDGSCGFRARTDHSGTPAGLDRAGLEDHGGPTQTIALDPGSAAIGGVGDARLCSIPDQRGVERPTPCDIGAVELVLKAQTIAFTSTPPSHAIVGGPRYAESARGGSSGNPVTFSIDASAASVCSISHASVSFIGEGTCVVDANQAGSARYSPALQAQQRFGVHRAARAITSSGGTTARVGRASRTT